MKPSNIFTPYTTRTNEACRRYRLFTRGIGLFSITPTGETFPGHVDSADCGLGCRCGAFLKPTTARGRVLLSYAAQIDSQSEVVKPLADMALVAALAEKLPTPSQVREHNERSALAREVRDRIAERLVQEAFVTQVDIPRPGEYPMTGYAARRRMQESASLVVATEGGDRFLVHFETLRNKVKP